MAYAEALTKEMLTNEYQVEYVGLNNLVYLKDGSITKRSISTDKYGRKYMVASIKNTATNEWKTFGLHRLLYVWYLGDIPDGYVVDHINNNSLDNRVSTNPEENNLQLLTQAENLEKERKLHYIIKMPKYKKYNKEKVEEKLNYYLDLYEQAKKDHDADKAHKLRASISQWRSRLKQIEANPELYEVSILNPDVSYLKKQVELTRNIYKADPTEYNKAAWKDTVKKLKEYRNSK